MLGISKKRSSAFIISHKPCKYSQKQSWFDFKYSVLISFDDHDECAELKIN